MLLIKRAFFSLLFVLSMVLLYYTVIVLEARDETPRIVQEVLNSDRIKLQLADFSDKQMNILLSVQDPRFYEHKGIDFQVSGSGKTTLAQGLCEFYFSDDFERDIEKIKLMLITRFAFNPLVPKHTQVLLFINEVYFGYYHGKEIRGFEDAAQTYFDKSFKELTEDEYIALVAMIRMPDDHNIKNHPEQHELRVMRVNKFLNGEYVPKDDSDQFYDRE